MLKWSVLVQSSVFNEEYVVVVEKGCNSQPSTNNYNNNQEVMSLLYQWMPHIWKLILQAVIHASHMIIHMIYGCSEAICKISFRLVCVKQNYSTCSKCLAYSISVNEALMCNKESDAVHYTPHG